MAFARVCTDADRLEALRELVVAMPEALECHGVTGEDCYVIKVAVASPHSKPPSTSSWVSAARKQQSSCPHP